MGSSKVLQNCPGCLGIDKSPQIGISISFATKPPLLVRPFPLLFNFSITDFVQCILGLTLSLHNNILFLSGLFPFFLIFPSLTLFNASLDLPSPSMTTSSSFIVIVSISSPKGEGYGLDFVLGASGLAPTIAGGL